MTKINVIIGIREALNGWRYRLAFISISVAFALFEMWLSSYSLIIFVYRSGAFSWRDRISILRSAITLFFAGLPAVSIVFTFLTALLVGLSVTLLVYYFKKRLALQSATGVGVAGMLASLLGVGCTSCGSVILSSAIGFTATTRLLTVLPLRGMEFSLFAVLMLLVSIYITARKIVNPQTCKIKK